MPHAAPPPARRSPERATWLSPAYHGRWTRHQVGQFGQSTFQTHYRVVPHLTDLHVRNCTTIEDQSHASESAGPTNRCSELRSVIAQCACLGNSELMDRRTGSSCGLLACWSRHRLRSRENRGGCKRRQLRLDQSAPGSTWTFRCSQSDALGM